MDSEKSWIDPECLPFDLSGLSEEYGDVLRAQIQCPGVYFLLMSPPMEHPRCCEIFLVTADAPISAEARNYGREIAGLPGLLFYEHEHQNGGWEIIEYEILKCRVRNKLSLDKFEDLHTVSVYGMELCPEYFGAYFVPNLTPWGYTTRYKVIHNGVYWLETDRCMSGLAISYVMRDDLSDVVTALSELNDYDREHGLDKTMGPLFFREEIMCLPLLELRQIYRGWDWGAVNQTALMNAVWTKFPEYAAAYNLQEQRGQHDMLGILMRTFGEESGLHSSPENMIVLTPGAGTKFLSFL